MQAGDLLLFSEQEEVFRDFLRSVRLVLDLPLT